MFGSLRKKSIINRFKQHYYRLLLLNAENHTNTAAQTTGKHANGVQNVHSGVLLMQTIPELNHVG